MKNHDCLWKIICFHQKSRVCNEKTELFIETYDFCNEKKHCSMRHWFFRWKLMNFLEKPWSSNENNDCSWKAIILIENSWLFNENIWFSWKMVRDEKLVAWKYSWLYIRIIQLCCDKYPSTAILSATSGSMASTPRSTTRFLLSSSTSILLYYL